MKAYSIIVIPILVMFVIVYYAQGSNGQLTATSTLTTFTTSYETLTETTFSNRPLIGVDYYLWYHAGKWSNPEALRDSSGLDGSIGAEPQLGEYSSNNIAVMQQDIKWFEQYGINFAALSWVPASLNSYIDSNAKLFASTGFPFCLMLAVTSTQSASQIQTAMNQAYTEFAGDSNYLQISGKPYFIIYNSNYKVTDSRFTELYVGGAYSQRDYHDIYPGKNPTFESDPSSLFVAHNVQSFVYEMQSSYAKGNNPLLITSWNEWHELSGIEPANPSYIAQMNGQSFTNDLGVKDKIVNQPAWGFEYLQAILSTWGN